jgi:hypothetical protein
MIWADLIAIKSSKYILYRYKSTPPILTKDPIIGTHSRKIRQSDAFIGVPIFQLVLGQPLYSVKLGENITGLGRLAGFEYRAILYLLYRGYANVLYINVSTKDRRFLMGYKTNSDIYSYYYSTISVISV